MKVCSQHFKCLTNFDLYTKQVGVVTYSHCDLTDLDKLQEQILTEVFKYMAGKYIERSLI